MTRSVMVDLETLGTDSDAPIVQIGAVIFDDETKTVHRDGPLGAFEMKVSLESENFGRLNGATLAWWLTQDSATLNHVLKGEPRFKLDAALLAFNDWLRAANAKEIWANAPTFDLAILRASNARFNMKFPMSFRTERCFRTLLSLGTAIGLRGFIQSGIAHDALADAIFQAESAVVILNRLKQPAVVS